MNSELFAVSKPIIGMVHLRPLPGSPLYEPGSMDAVCATACEEALLLQQGGVDGVQIENIWDYPYLKCDEIGYETVAALTAAAVRVKETVQLPVGINCHLNGVMQSVAAAVASEASWVRVFEWTNAYISHAGYVEGVAGKAVRYRNAIGGRHIKFLCDVNVKHGSHFIISDRSVKEQARDAESEGSDAIIVTGWETGSAPSLEQIRSVKDSISVPLYLGSGLNAENARDLLAVADGAIVGSDFKEGGNWKRPVDIDRVRDFMSRVKNLRKSL